MNKWFFIFLMVCNYCMAEVGFVGTDTQTQGNWQGRYGNNGYMLFSTTDTMSQRDIITYNLGNNGRYVWESPSSDTRALFMANANYRVAACMYNSTTAIISLRVGLPSYRVAVYIVDWDTSSRSEELMLYQPGTTGNTAVTINSPVFHNGIYAIWNVSGVQDISLQVRARAGDNWVISGIFVDTLQTTNTQVVVDAPKEASKGQLFDVPVRINNVNGLAGYQAGILFNAEVLQAVSVTEGNMPGSPSRWIEPSISEGRISNIACARLAKGGMNGTGILFTIRFRAANGGDSLIQVADMILANSNGQPIPFNTQNDTVNIKRYPPYDVDMDGMVTIYDVVIVAQHFGERNPNPPNPDVNGDGIVDIVDLIIVCQHFGESAIQGAPGRNPYTVDSKYIPLLQELSGKITGLPKSIIDRAIKQPKGATWGQMKDSKIQ